MNKPMEGIDLCEVVTKMSQAIKACNTAAKEKRLDDNMNAYDAVGAELGILMDVGVTVIITERWESSFVTVVVKLENLEI